MLCISRLIAGVLTAASLVVGGQWTDDPYDVTTVKSKPKGQWQPDAMSLEFTVMVMPDTQYLFDENRIHPVPMEASFEYIVSPNRSEADKNIVFVSHLGDVAQNGLAKEYAAVTKLFDYMDESGVEYSVLAGNHDIDSSTDDQRGPTPYLDVFNPKRFSKIRSWRGSSPDGYNNYHVFHAGGREWLVLALDWRMSSGTFKWASDVLRKHADLPTILTTHELVTADSGKTEFSEYGERVWNELVKDNDQIFLTLNGHFWPPGRTTRKNAAGRDVESHITNYQNRYYGGAGMIRAYRFNMKENKIDVATFSPWIQNLVQRGEANKLAKQEEELTSADDKFTMHINFAERFEHLGKSKRENKNGNDAVIPGTLAYWRFDGSAHSSNSSGSSPGSALAEFDIIKDLSGHGNDLVTKSANASSQHTILWSDQHHPSQPGYGSLKFTGQKKPLKGMYLQTRKQAPLNSETFENGYTFEAFYLVPSSWNSEQNAWSGIFSRRGSAGEANKHSNDTDSDEPIVTLSLSNDRELQWRVYPLHQDGGTTNWSHETPFDRWWHVAVINNGTLTKMYVDGSEVARNPTQWVPGLTTLNKPWMLGGFEYGGKLDQIFYGSIGDVRIVNRALSLDELMFQDNQ